MMRSRRFRPERLLRKLRPALFGIDLHWLPAGLRRGARFSEGTINDKSELFAPGAFLRNFRITGILKLLVREAFGWVTGSRGLGALTDVAQTLRGELR